MKTFTQLKEDLKAECVEAMIKSCGGIFAEYEIREDDYLLVNFEPLDHGIKFSFCIDHQTFFSGEIEKTCTGFIIPFDEYTENLDSYFELADLEIMEGYLLPNNLLRDDD